MVVLRLVVLCLFLTWRISNPNYAAYGLWLVSVICETWFGVSWILDQVGTNRRTATWMVNASLITLPLLASGCLASLVEQRGVSSSSWPPLLVMVPRCILV